MSTSRKVVELLAERDGDGWLVRAPRVGIYRDGPPAGRYRAAGESAGRLRVLNRTIALVLPGGVEGLVGDVRVNDLSVAVEYGQPLFRLDPAGLSDEAGPRETAVATAHRAAAPEGLPEGCHGVFSPIDGVFYRRGSPTSPPFVEAGAIIETGATIGLVEAMKSFNAVAYGGPGLPLRAEVVDVRAADAAEVRQGTLLVVVRAAPQG